MPVLYKPFQSVLEDKNKKKLFHPRVIYTANVTTTQLAKEIAAYSSLSTGDVKNTLDNLVTVAARRLRNFPHGDEVQRQRCGTAGESIGCPSFPYRPLPAQLYQESRPYHCHPFFGDRCQVCPFRSCRYFGFRWRK